MPHNYEDQIRQAFTENPPRDEATAAMITSPAEQADRKLMVESVFRMGFEEGWHARGWRWRRPPRPVLEWDADNNLSYRGWRQR